MKNNTNDNFISDEQLLVLLECKEAGKSFPDALTALGNTVFSLEETQTLKSLWNMHSNLMEEARTISPKKALLSRIVEQSGTGSGAHVTTRTDAGYSSYGAEGTFISLRNNLHLIMQRNWKIVAPIAVVVIVAGVAMSGGSKEPEHLALNNLEIAADAPRQESTGVESQGAPTTMAMKTTAPTTLVTGNLDDLMASITSEGDGDLMLIDGSAEDAALVTDDSQSINDFNTIYDETTF